MIGIIIVETIVKVGITESNRGMKLSPECIQGAYQVLFLICRLVKIKKTVLEKTVFHFYEERLLLLDKARCFLSGCRRLENKLVDSRR